MAPQDETSNRSAEDDPKATDELKDAVYARVVLYAIQFRYGRGQECVVAAREDAVEYDEDDKSLTVRVEPEGEYGDSGQDDLKCLISLDQRTASERGWATHTQDHCILASYAVRKDPHTDPREAVHPIERGE